MTGRVNHDLEVVLPVELCGSAGDTRLVGATIDTGSNGYLTLSRALISELGLSSHGPVEAVLGNGSCVTLQRYLGAVIWHGTQRTTVILEAEGEPLLGMALLRGSRVTIDAQPGGTVNVEALGA